MKLSLPRSPCTEEEIEALNKISNMVQCTSKSFQRVGVLQVNPVLGLLETLEMVTSEMGFMLQAREMNDYSLLLQKIFGTMRQISEVLLKRKSISLEAPTTNQVPLQGFELKSSVHALGRFGGTRISSERINTENTKQLEFHQQELLQEVIKQQKKLDVQVILKRYDPKIKIQLSKGTDTSLDAREKIRNFNSNTDEHELLFNDMMNGHQENMRELEKAIGSKTDFVAKQYSGVVDYIKSISKLIQRRTIEFEGAFTDAQKKFVESIDDNLDEFIKYIQTSYKDVQMETYKVIMKYLHHKQEQDRMRYVKQESFLHQALETPNPKHKKISQKTSLHNNANTKGTEKVAKELIEKSSELTQKQLEISDLAKKFNQLRENNQHSEKEVEQMRLQQLKLEHDRQKLQYELSKLEKQLVSQHHKPTNDQFTQTDHSDLEFYLQNQTNEWRSNENESPSIDKSRMILRQNSKSSDGKYNLLDLQRGTEDGVLQSEFESPDRKTTSSKVVVSRINDKKTRIPQLSIDNNMKNKPDLSESIIYNKTYSQFSQNSNNGEKKTKKSSQGREEFPELSGDASKRISRRKDESLQSSIYGQSPDDLVLQSQINEGNTRNKRPSLQLEKSQKLDKSNDINRQQTKSTGGRRVTSKYDGRKKDISERIDEEESSPLRQRPYDTTRSTAIFLNSPVNSVKNQTLENRFDISAQGQNRKNLKTQFLGTQQPTWQDSNFDTVRKQVQMEDESSQTEDFLLMEKFLHFLQQVELSQDQKEKVLNFMKKQQEFIPYKLQNEFSGGKLSTTAFQSPKSLENFQEKVMNVPSTPQPPVPLFFKSRQYRSSEKLDSVDKPHFKVEALRPEDIVMETMNTALEGEDLDDIDGYTNKHNDGVPLTSLSDKEITQAQTIKKLYNQFVQRQNNKSVAELKNIILRYHKKNDTDQVTEKMFGEFYQKMIVVHKRCGEGCPHLRRFFMRLGFIHARYLNRKILRPYKSVVTPF